MSWQFDAPLGVYRNFALSSDIRREAIADVQFMRWLRAEPGYGKHKGESVTITRVLQLPLATQIAELDNLPQGRPPIETKQVSVAEWGYAVPMTEFEMNLSHFDITNPIQAALRDQMALTMDVMAADAYKLTPLKYTPTATGFTLTTNGTAGALADRNVQVQDLRNIHDELRDLKVPAFRNGKYIGILSTQAARGIKDDPEYKEWIAPTDSSPIMTGRLKDIEGFALFETNHLAALASDVGASTTTGEAIFFGADACGLVRVQDPELRATVPIPETLGRMRLVGWVGTINAFLVWEQAARARAIHVTST